MRPLGSGRFLFSVGWRTAAFVGLSLAGPWIATTIQTATGCAGREGACLAISAATGFLLRPLILLLLALALIRPSWRRARTVGLWGAAGLLVPLLLLLDWRTLTAFGPSYIPVSFRLGLLDSGFPFFTLLALAIVIVLAAARPAAPGDPLRRRQGVVGRLGWAAALVAVVAGAAAGGLHLSWLAHVAAAGMTPSPAFARAAEAGRVAHIAALAATALLALTIPAALSRSKPAAAATT
jgi:hypothetical protein